jgi:hypothetical protein
MNQLAEECTPSRCGVDASCARYKVTNTSGHANTSHDNLTDAILNAERLPYPSSVFDTHRNRYVWPTINRDTLREALNTVGISTQDLTELRVDPHKVTITRLARNTAGNTYVIPGTINLATTTEIINITD